MIPKRTVALVASVLCIGAVLAGCGATSAGSPRAASPTETTESSGQPDASEPTERPRDIKLDGKDPCALVPQSDWAMFYIEKAGKAQQNKTFQSPECFYGTNMGGARITLVVTEGIEAWTDGGRNVDIAEAAPVEGFPAISVLSKVDQRGCDAVVDVADGQYLMAATAVEPSEESQVGEKCEFSLQLAGSAMKTLVAW